MFGFHSASFAFPLAALRPQRHGTSLLFEQLDEDAADDTASGKSAAFRGTGEIPVGHRNTRFRVVNEAVNRFHDRVETFTGIRERRRPDFPVEFRVVRPIVERQPKLIH